MRHFRGARPLALLVAAVMSPVPALAAHWVVVGKPAGHPNGKVMVDTDSLRKIDPFIMVDIMTVYDTPVLNSHDITLDSFVQKTAFDCAMRTFVGVSTTGYLKGKPVGASRDIPDWRSRMEPLPDDTISNRIYVTVCRPAASEPKSK